MIKTWLHFATSIIASLTLFSFLNTCDAQDEITAFCRVDINLEKLRENPLVGQSLDHLSIADFGMSIFKPDIKISQIKRIEGQFGPNMLDTVMLFEAFLSLPKIRQYVAEDGKVHYEIFDRKTGEEISTTDEDADRDAIMKRASEISTKRRNLGRKFPTLRPEFYLRMEFNDERSGHAAIIGFFGRSMTRTTIDGKTCYRFPLTDKAFAISFSDNNRVVEICSDKYLGDKNALKCTTEIENYFDTHADMPVRIAFDLKHARTQIDRTPRLKDLSGFAELVVNQCSFAGFTMSLDEKQLFSINLESPSEDRKQVLNENVNDFVKPVWQAGPLIALDNFKSGTDEMKAFEQMLEQCKFNASDLNVDLVIERPEHFDPMVATMVSNVKKEAEVNMRRNYFGNVAVAIHDFHDAYDRCPFPEPFHENVGKDLSWRVLILPFFEGQLYYRKFATDQLWNSENNLPLSKDMFPPYGFDKPGEKTSICWIKTTDKRISIYDIPDGPSETIMLMENPNKVIWSKADDITIDEAVKLVKNLPDGEKLAISFYDASTFAVSNKMDLEMFRAMLTIDGGEKVDRSKIK